MCFSVHRLSTVVIVVASLRSFAFALVVTIAWAGSVAAENGELNRRAMATTAPSFGPPQSEGSRSASSWM